MYNAQIRRNGLLIYKISKLFLLFFIEYLLPILLIQKRSELKKLLKPQQLKYMKYKHHSPGKHFKRMYFRAILLILFHCILIYFIQKTIYFDKLF